MKNWIRGMFLGLILVGLLTGCGSARVSDLSYKAELRSGTNINIERNTVLSSKHAVFIGESKVQTVNLCFQVDNEVKDGAILWVGMNGCPLDGSAMVSAYRFELKEIEADLYEVFKDSVTTVGKVKREGQGHEVLSFCDGDYQQNCEGLDI